MQAKIGALAVLLFAASTAGSQSLGSLAADRLRLAEITGDTAAARVWLEPAPWRAPSPRLGVALELVGPELRAVWNSDLPYSGNDASLWAGRGGNGSVQGGVRAATTLPGRVTLRAALLPMAFYSRNLPFQVIANRTSGRSGWANPFHGPEASLDLPHRFGDRPLLGYDFGNSSLSAEWKGAMIGATTESQWWGPAMRNAIVMSNNAPGIPRYFVKTAHPVSTPVGAVDAQLFSGTLTKSRFFASDQPAYRSVGGFLVQLHPAFDSTLTFGVARVVYAPLDGGDSPALAALSRASDPLTRWETINDTQGSDQIDALFARWIFPRAGFEVYGEWARMEPPRSLNEFLAAAHYSGGWTFGFQWANDRGGETGNGKLLRLQSELTYLEQSVVFPDRATPDFYSGRASPAGYTQRGQVIGASTGPGSSSQFFGADWIAPRWQAGAFIQRIRWDNDALYRQQAATFFSHDVSLLAGLRGGWRSALSDFSAELTFGKRFNYLFQSSINNPARLHTVDVNNITLALVVTPR